MDRLIRSADASLPAVLVVDDEEVVRTLAAEILTQSGLKVFEAADAVQAIARLDEQPEIRAMIADVFMPGPLDGLDLGYVVSRRHPRVGLIITSSRLIEPLNSILPDAQYLVKPFSPAALCSAVRRAIASGASPLPGARETRS